MPKKLKKTLNKKTKLKNTVNVKINIDNSKKSTTRRASTKPPAQQPFVNFPTFQPTRIQQLEPKQQFNNADLSKTMDEYQKQFKTYLETKDKDVKKMIEEFDDTLKKNIAPPKKDESKPGASNVYADNEGEVIFEQPIKKVSWTKPNELKQNTMLETEVEPLSINQLFEEAKPLNIKEVVRGLGEEELKEGISEAKSMKLENNIMKKYEDYVSAYKQYYGDENYEKKMLNENGIVIPASTWAVKESALLKKIKRYNTSEEQLIQESEMKKSEQINKQNKKD